MTPPSIDATLAIELPDNAAEPLPPAPRDLPEVVIEPRSGLRAIDFADLWRYRELLYTFMWRDVKTRYKQTAVGAAWAVLQPALITVVFTIFIGPMVHTSADVVPYPVFVYSGFLAWNFFTVSITNAGMSVLVSERLISRVYFPRLLMPLASVGANLVDFVVGACGLVCLLAWYGMAPSINLLWVPLWLGFMMLGAAGIGTLMAALNVKYRDFRYLLPFLIQLWLFATPTIFLPAAETPQSVVAGTASMAVKTRFWLVNINPMSGLIEFFRAMVFGGPIPWEMLGVSFMVIVVVFITACYFFRNVEDKFVDVI